MATTDKHPYKVQTREFESWYEDIDPGELATAEPPDNGARAGNALAALRVYAERTGDCHIDAKIALTDLIADVLHLGDLLGVNIYDAVEIAERRYDEEIRGDI